MFKERGVEYYRSKVEPVALTPEQKSKINEVVSSALIDMAAIKSRIDRNSREHSNLPYDQLAFLKASLVGIIARLETAKIVIPISLQKFQGLLSRLISDKENYDASEALSRLNSYYLLANFAVERLTVT